MHFFLILFLALACMPEVGRDWPRPPWIPGPLIGAICSGLSVAALALWASWPTLATTRALQRDPFHREGYLKKHNQGQRRFQIALFAGFMAILCLAGWGWTVGQFWCGQEEPKKVLPGAELLILAPFFILLLLSWWRSYRFERAFYLASLQPISPVNWNLESQESHLPPLLQGPGNYLVYKLRNPLVLVAIPLLLLLLQKDLGRCFPHFLEGIPHLTNILGFLGIGLIFLAMPWLIRGILNLKPLPAGPLRDRLLQTARRCRFRCSDLLVWNTQGGMANAMVVGIVPWPRYVVFTDKMLEEFTPEELAAVLGHEMGHIKHHHMFFYMLFLVSSAALLGLILNCLVPGWLDSGEAPGLTSDNFLDPANHLYLQLAPVFILVLGYIFLVFGFLSRRCERQADIYGCRAASDQEAITPQGIETFVRSLEKVGRLNGISLDRPGFLQSWQHSTIARRIAFLEQMRVDPQVEQKFQRRIWMMQWGMVSVLGLVVCLLSLMNGWSF